MVRVFGSSARLCPPEAFGDKSENPLFEGGGGLTYDLLMQEVVQQLEAYCNPPDGDSPVNVSALSASELVEYQANYKRVQIDWYLSTEHQDSEEGALAMMCNGNWRASDMISPLSSSSPMCPSSKTYQVVQQGLHTASVSTNTHHPSAPNQAHPRRTLIVILPDHDEWQILSGSEWCWQHIMHFRPRPWLLEQWS